MHHMWTLIAVATLSLLLSAGCSRRDDSDVNLRSKPDITHIANIPPQCYTRTKDVDGKVQNPCYVCHADAQEPNYQSQPENQQSYAFPSLQRDGKTPNLWSNFFVDRSKAIAAISDDAALRYVRTDNYRDTRGRIELAERLRQLPKAWDVDGDGHWGGYLPDAAFRFDAEGFDHDAQDQQTGWRAFAYFPFPGTFMPTNGAFDDVLIRLPAAFREREDGTPDRGVYKINLAIVESLLRRRDVAIDATDEKALNADLDGDGQLGTAAKIKYDWAPLEKRFMWYVGRARIEQQADRLHAAAGLLPEGTEFLHSVRYLDVAADGGVTPAPRMKELRYSRKQRWVTYSTLRNNAIIEAKEAAMSPDEPELYYGDAERGMQSKLGWTYQGFIEDKRGRLRPQTQEESQFCLGCHGGLSATDDTVFSLSRKLGSGPAHGWYQWAAQPFKQLPDPLRADGKPEFASYLLANEAGDEYRANDEVRARFFDAEGKPRAEAFERLKTDLSTLMLPSRERALALNKAYWLIVREQSYTHGRDAVLHPAENFWREIEQDAATGIETPLPAPRLAP